METDVRYWVTTQSEWVTVGIDGGYSTTTYATRVGWEKAAAGAHVEEGNLPLTCSEKGTIAEENYAHSATSSSLTKPLDSASAGTAVTICRNLNP